mmetsp:Transcript_52800/g.105783  ORF Transcript_52800/g.105783 Transcript_52800/m.105783 type:complete len:240 (-) Transcript_52800:45-764(-)
MNSLMPLFWQSRLTRVPFGAAAAAVWSRVNPSLPRWFESSPNFSSDPLWRTTRPPRANAPPSPTLQLSSLTSLMVGWHRRPSAKCLVPSSPIPELPDRSSFLKLPLAASPPAKNAHPGTPRKFPHRLTKRRSPAGWAKHAASGAHAPSLKPVKLKSKNLRDPTSDQRGNCPRALLRLRFRVRSFLADLVTHSSASAAAAAAVGERGSGDDPLATTTRAASSLLLRASPAVRERKAGAFE